jgi:RNA polymerase sigma-70 factor (ECF subfamily)
MWLRVNTIVGTRLVPDQDADLMLRVRDGDEECFAVLLEKHRKPVVNFVYRMVQERPVAEELAQEVFLRIYRSRASYEPTARFTTWMFRIATHLALNWLRDEKHQRSQERLDDDRPGGAAGGELPDQRPSTEQRMLYDARLQEGRDCHAA